jgi:hypothetical protein
MPWISGANGSATTPRESGAWSGGGGSRHELFSSRKAEPEQPTPTDIEIIRAKLSDCAAQIEAAERDRDQASLSIALVGDDNANKDVLARLAELHGKRELLTAALRRAEQQERDEQGRLNAREWLARKRSLAQRTDTLTQPAPTMTDWNRAAGRTISLLTTFAAKRSGRRMKPMSTPERRCIGGSK